MVNSINAHLRLKVTPTPHGILSLDKYKLNFSNQIYFKNIYLKMITEHRQHFHAF